MEEQLDMEPLITDTLVLVLVTSAPTERQDMVSAG